jgi:DNA-binding response OmpR family regulator
VADLALDTARHEVRRAGRLIDLSPREFALLEYLMRHPQQVLTRTQIAEHVWNFDFYSETNVVDVYIGYLRRKIDRGFQPPLIHTVRGVEYRVSFVAEKVGTYKLSCETHAPTMTANILILPR